MRSSSTEILLATYNGAAFLQDLLASLDAQTDQDWTLVVRDDGSTDDTESILSAWGAAHPGRLRWLCGGGRNLGPAENFGTLLAASEADRFLLCDQDDVWLPEKVERLKRGLAGAEARSGRSTPILVHSDLIVTDARLERIAGSFWHYQRMRFPSDEEPWKILVVQNVVTGCAMIGNAALRKAALPIPPEAMMHDWWLALVAATMGRIIHDPEPSVLYRQHGGNSIGASSYSTASSLDRILSSPAGCIAAALSSLSRTRLQARRLIAIDDSRIPAAARAFMTEYSQLGSAPLIRRKTFPFRQRLWFSGLLRNVAFVVLN